MQSKRQKSIELIMRIQSKNEENNKNTCSIPNENMTHSQLVSVKKTRLKVFKGEACFYLLSNTFFVEVIVRESAHGLV